MQINDELFREMSFSDLVEIQRYLQDFEQTLINMSINAINTGEIQELNKLKNQTYQAIILIRKEKARRVEKLFPDLHTDIGMLTKSFAA